MKSADWLHVTRPILLVCISLADIDVTLYQKWGTISPFLFPFPFLLFSPSIFPSLSFPSSLPSLLYSFPSLLFLSHSHQIQLGVLGNTVNDAYAGWSRYTVTPPPVIFWQVSTSHIAFSSRLQVASRSHFLPVSHISLRDWLRGLGWGPKWLIWLWTRLSCL